MVRASCASRRLVSPAALRGVTLTLTCNAKAAAHQRAQHHLRGRLHRRQARALGQQQAHVEQQLRMWMKWCMGKVGRSSTVRGWEGCKAAPRLPTQRQAQMAHSARTMARVGLPSVTSQDSASHAWGGHEIRKMSSVPAEACRQGTKVHTGCLSERYSGGNGGSGGGGQWTIQAARRSTQHPCAATCAATRTGPICSQAFARWRQPLAGCSPAAAVMQALRQVVYREAFQAGLHGAAEGFWVPLPGWLLPVDLLPHAEVVHGAECNTLMPSNGCSQYSRRFHSPPPL